MPENKTQQPPEPQNTPSAPADAAAVKAQLTEEQKAAAAASEKDARIAALEAALSEAKKGSEAKAKDLETSQAQLAQVKAARDQAVARYLATAKATNPQIPDGIVAGETIEQIDASLAKGKAIVESVRKSLEAEAAATKVPAGAPPRGSISLEGLSPREKIAAGIQQKGGA